MDTRLRVAMRAWMLDPSEENAQKLASLVTRACCPVGLELEIAGILTCSTRHVTAQQYEDFQNAVVGDDQDYQTNYNYTDNFIISNAPFGYILTGFEEIFKDAPPRPAIHKNLLNLFQLAFENGCIYIRLDADGPIIPGLEVFHW